MIDNRSKMRRSHQKVKEFLQSKKFDLIHIIHHSRWSLDLWNMFDGLAVKDSIVYFLQIKSNSWNNFNDFKDFCIKYSLNGIFFNVQDRKGIKIRAVGNDYVDEVLQNSE